MAGYVVNVAINDPFDGPLRDGANALITGKTTSDFTVSAILVSNPAVAASVAVSEMGTSTGKYKITFTPTQIGLWAAYALYNSGGVFREFTGTYDVLPAAADPSAIATAIADLFDQPVSEFTNSNTLGGRIKMITAGTRS